MNKPVLYSYYTREEAVACFGRPSEAKNRCNDQWVHFPAVSICFATLGDQASYFRSAGKFCWVTNEHYRWGDPTAFVPKEVRGGRGAKRFIFLFVQNGLQKWKYLGELDPTYAIQHASLISYGQADFDFTPALPSEVWTELGGFDAGDIDHAKIDAALDKLRGTTSLMDRTEVLKRLVEYWYGPVGSRDGFGEGDLDGMAMPTVLRHWYRWAGRRKEIMTGQNILLVPKSDRFKYEELYFEDERLVFYHENQCVYKWATLAEGDDPPVFGRYEKTDPWEQEGMTVSEHLIAACLFDAIGCRCKYGASIAWLEDKKVSEIIGTIPPVAIGPWRWLDISFRAGRGAFIYTSSDSRGGGSLWVGAKTEHPLQFLKPYLSKDWEYISV